MFYGPPGTGKTTIAEIIAKELKAEMLKLNASDERGIDVVRGQIKMFAMQQSFGDEKIVFLDEADGLTKDAQNSLRSIIEHFSDNCRFIMTANNINKLIPALQERPMDLPMAYLTAKDIVNYLSRINKKEGYGMSKEVLVYIAKKSRGSARRACNNILRVRLLYKQNVTLERIKGMYKKDALPKLVDIIAKDKALYKALKYALRLTSDYSVSEMLVQLLYAFEDYYKDTEHIEVFAKIACILGEHEWRLRTAADDIGTLYSAISNIYLEVK